MIQISAAKAWAAAGALLMALCSCPGAAQAAQPSAARASALPVQAAASAPAAAHTDASDTGWGGYALQDTAATAASGTFEVPEVSGSANTIMSTWVGIGGIPSSTQQGGHGSLIQAGTDEMIVNGIPSYSAWTEIYPSPPVYRNDFPVAAGDQVRVRVEYTAATKQVVFTLKSARNGDRTYTDTANTAPDNSVEWINERTAMSYPDYASISSTSNTSLPEFSNVTFTAASYEDASGGPAPEGPHGHSVHNP